MIKLHYAKLTDKNNIPCLEFNNQKDFNNFLFKVTKNIVYLFCFDVFDDKQEIFITQDLTLIGAIMSECFDLIQSENIFYLQEYTSFEEAYQVALSMQETSELCYTK